MKHLPVDSERLVRVCRHQHMKRLSLFGSVRARTDRPDSDVDLLVEFEQGRTPGFLHLAGIEAELSDLLGGWRMDLRTPQDISRYVRKEVMRSAEVLFAA